MCQRDLEDLQASFERKNKKINSICNNYLAKNAKFAMIRYINAQENIITFCQLFGTINPIPNKDNATPSKVDPLTKVGVIVIILLF